MASFEKIGSGISGIDAVLEWIRIGDNVVWQVDSVDDYRMMAERFAEQALRDKRDLIYIRFAPHESILEEREGLTVHRLDPTLGFEHFTGEVHRIVEKAGLEAFYVFDCLSELQTAWAADLMMGNFFTVTCPYLFELDTVAWFCILRHRHSYDTIARIRDTTQLLLDLYREDDSLFYVHPIKVWKRYSPTMFFPHKLDLKDPDRVFPVTDGVSISRFYRLAGLPGDAGGGRDLDSWERFFIDARKTVAENPELSASLVRPMAERLIGSDARFMDLVLANCTAKDLLEVKDRMIGSGKIGGKAAGLLLSRKIVGRTLGGLAGRIEPHDSFFVGSDVFYTYLVHNRLWRLRIHQRTEDGYYRDAPALKDGMLAGTFPDRIREQFIRILEYFGQTPIIVRSSSLLEDSFGHAFAGKYESVFCVNTGDPEERLKAFEDALRTVFASTMDASALSYRQQRGLQKQDEQMAILVQRVSGSLFGSFFMPAVAGVGYSFNAWRWHPDLDPRAGMVRLVAGLGTRAVDRTASDYPRLAGMDRPELSPSGDADRSRYCQRSMDVLDLASRRLETRPLDETLAALPQYLVDIVAERDFETERRLAETGQSRRILIGTCSGAVSQKKLMEDLKAIMQTLQKEYGNPVDMEFTVNWSAGGDYLINLLQCRPLQTSSLQTALESESGKDSPAAMENGLLSKGNVFFSLHRDIMGPQLDRRVDAVVIVDPLEYFNLPYRDKPTVARTVGLLNAHYGEAGKTVMLLAPGRIGTSSPELGLPVTFAEIDRIAILCEVACSEAGYQPELSFGSHFFQDLVETGTFYAAIPENDPLSVYNPDFFGAEENLFAGIVPGSTLPPSLVRVYEPERLVFYSDIVNGKCLCAGFTVSRR